MKPAASGEHGTSRRSNSIRRRAPRTTCRGCSKGWLVFEAVGRSSEGAPLSDPAVLAHRLAGRAARAAAAAPSRRANPASTAVRVGRPRGARVARAARADDASAPRHRGAGGRSSESRSFRYPGGRYWSVAEYVIRQPSDAGAADAPRVAIHRGSAEPRLHIVAAGWRSYSDHQLADLLWQSFPARADGRPEQGGFRRRRGDLDAQAVTGAHQLRQGQRIAASGAVERPRGCGSSPTTRTSDDRDSARTNIRTQAQSTAAGNRAGARGAGAPARGSVRSTVGARRRRDDGAAAPPRRCLARSGADRRRDDRAQAEGARRARGPRSASTADQATGDAHVERIRDFVDANGCEWRAWAVIPGQASTSSTRNLGDLRNGWLAFESLSGSGKRRLIDFPDDWMMLDDDAARAAARASSRRTGAEALGRPRLSIA